ncbi:MAG: FCD domain-containing protein [Marmoricola sp.]
MRPSGSVQQVGTSALNEHAAIAEAVRAGDPTAAARAMRAHLIAARNRLRPMCGDQ